MTNKEKFKEIFGIEVDCGSCNPYPCNKNDCAFWDKCESELGRPCVSWWDWEYKGPTQQEPIFDELRAEIKHFMYNVNPSSSESDYACNYILQIIDKYNAESEG